MPRPPAATTPNPVHHLNAYSEIRAQAALVQLGLPCLPGPCLPRHHPSIMSRTPTAPSPYLLQYQHSRKPKTGCVQLASIPLSACPLSPSAFVRIPILPIPTEDTSPESKGMKHFCSLSILCPGRGKAKSAGYSSPSLLSPTKAATYPKSSKLSKMSKKQPIPHDAAAISKPKQAKYAHVHLPPPFANKLALMQFIDGGRMEENVKCVMEAQAKAERSGVGLAVGNVYRDRKGGIWWDADKEMDYMPLLGGKSEQELMKEAQDMDMEWEMFGSAPPSPLDLFHSREVPVVAISSLGGIENARCEFFEDSFSPSPVRPVAPRP